MRNRNSIIILLSFLFFNQAAPKTIEPIKFKADRMEYNYKKGSEQVTGRGNADINRSDFYLKAQLINIYGVNRDYVKAYNNIKMVNKVNNIEIYGDYAEYDNIEGYAKVFRSPRLISTNQKLEIESATMETFLNENKSVAIGDVKITQTNYVAYSEKAVYWQNKDIIELTGSPVVYYQKNILRAKKIVVYTKNNIVKLYDSVGARIASKKEEE